MTDMSGQVHSHCTGFTQGNQLPSETETAEWLEIKKVWKQQLQLGTEKIKCPELREGILHEHNEMPSSTRGCFQWAGMETIPGAHVIRIHLNMKWISENGIWHSTVPMLIWVWWVHWGHAEENPCSSEAHSKVSSLSIFLSAASSSFSLPINLFSF